MLAALVVLATQVCLGQHLENDLQSLLHDLDVNQGAPPLGDADDDFEVEVFYRPEPEERAASPPASVARKGGEGVRRLWGVADTEAQAGRLFSYPIPADAFEGDVVSYKVKGLPWWLYWDSERGVVEGVPRSADRGHHYVTIKAQGNDGALAKDVFAVDVIELPGTTLSHEAGCHPKEDVTVLSVILNAHLPTLDSKARVRLLRSAIKFLGAKEVSLVSAPHDSDPLADDSAILAGPGSARLTNTGRRSESLSQLQWVVGCGGEVSKNKQKEVDHTEATAKNGELQRVLSVPVLGWHVTQVNPTSRRVRRDTDYSGDYNYDAYDYNYEYEEKDGDEEFLTFDDYEPETRVIPSLATPVFPEASATYYPGHGGYPDDSLHFSPVPISTPVYVPVKPTRVVEASPTVTYETAYPTDAPFIPELEGSIVSQPSTSVESTTPLTTTETKTKKPISPTRPIESTSVPTVAVTTEIGVKNFAPRVKKRIQKLAWIAGHVYRLPIPRDTFEDVEDGDTSNLRLLFKTSQGITVGRNSWIQFNPAKQEIYALPLEKNIGRYTYLLEALDSEGKTTTDSVMIHVQQAREARNYNHRFTATFKLEKKYEFEFVYSLDWQVKAVEKIAQTYNDPTTDNINIRSISLNPIRLTWTNTSLADPRSTVCPSDELEALAEVVISGDDHEMTREIKEAFQPEFHLKRVHLHYLGPCERHGLSKPGPPRPPQPDEPDVSGGGSEVYVNEPPIIRNQIDFLNATQGSLFRFQVPIDTCYDLEDGDSRRLTMRLLTSNLSPPPLDSWLQFDAANQEFFGIPLAGDTGKTEYILECVDNGGEKVNDALFVNVLPRPSRKMPPVEFSMKIDTNYQQFMSDARQKARLIDRIKEVFSDADAGHIIVDSFRKGSVILTWHNGSLPAEPCPNEDIRKLREIMVDSNGQLLQEFIDAFSPDFKVTGGSVKPTGACLGEDTPTHIEEEIHHPPVEEGIQGEENDYLLNFIIPAVIIAAMLLLAAIIACCLYRRRRYGKMTMADDRTFVSKGIPIIFAEELDDRPDPAKSPVIMKDEKPPLPPPEYQRGSSPAASSTPPTSDRRRPQSGDVADDTPSYQPPPPFTATNGASRHPRPNMPPTYRKPPTYVPP